MRGIWERALVPGQKIHLKSLSLQLLAGRTPRLRPPSMNEESEQDSTSSSSPEAAGSYTVCALVQVLPPFMQTLAQSH